MTRKSLLLCLALTWLGASGAGAAEPRPLAPGDRIRVEAHGLKQPVVGQLLSLDADHLRVLTQDRFDSTVVNRPDITALARSAGRHSRGRGAAIGAGIGIVAAGVTGLALGSDGSGDGDVSAGEKALLLAIPLALMGALIGSIPTPGERWEKIPVNTGPVGSLRLDAAGPQIAVTMRF